MPGCSRRRVAAACGTRAASADWKPATRTRPVRRPTIADSSAAAVSTRPTISAARRARCSPSGVSRMPRPTRWTSRAPVSASSRARWWLTAGWE